MRSIFLATVGLVAITVSATTAAEAASRHRQRTYSYATPRYQSVPSQPPYYGPPPGDFYDNKAAESAIY
jgi:hypothetical protein